ncbi:MAG: DUF4167 domain-containing protein [Paracoccus sp. (in: a-proteobacteria)]|nr:DUF4167 domain-containing protein [Paracoccus sp. (in: a-proteobacteria)]
MRSSKSRSRNKSNRQRSLGNIVNRVFDSSGPEGKVRGTPQQIIDKYLALARDAQLSGDRVAEQSFLQHAEHYTRMLGEAQREMAERQQQNQQSQHGRDGRDDDRDGNGVQSRDGRDDRDANGMQSRDPRDEQREDVPRDDQPEVVQQPPQPDEPAGLPEVSVDEDTGPVATPETAPEPPAREERPRRPRAPRSTTPRPRRRSDDTSGNAEAPTGGSETA